jgi:hypothetical protein
LIECQKESIDQNGAGQSNIESIMSANSPEEVKEHVVFGSIRYNYLLPLFRRNHLTLFEVWCALRLFFVLDWNHLRRFVDIFFRTLELFLLSFFSGFARVRTLFFILCFIFTGRNRYVIFKKLHLLLTLLLFFGVLMPT